MFVSYVIKKWHSEFLLYILYWISEKNRSRLHLFFVLLRDASIICGRRDDYYCDNNRKIKIIILIQTNIPIWPEKEDLDIGEKRVNRRKNVLSSN